METEVKSKFISHKEACTQANDISKNYPELLFFVWIDLDEHTKDKEKCYFVDNIAIKIIRQHIVAIFSNGKLMKSK